MYSRRCNLRHATQLCHSTYSNATMHIAHYTNKERKSFRYTNCPYVYIACAEIITIIIICMIYVHRPIVNGCTPSCAIYLITVHRHIPRFVRIGINVRAGNWRDEQVCVKNVYLYATVYVTMLYIYRYLHQVCCTSGQTDFCSMSLCWSWETSIFIFLKYYKASC